MSAAAACDWAPPSSRRPRPTAVGVDQLQPFLESSGLQLDEGRVRVDRHLLARRAGTDEALAGRAAGERA
jgi:hypothetical protein